MQAICDENGNVKLIVDDSVEVDLTPIPETKKLILEGNQLISIDQFGNKKVRMTTNSSLSVQEFDNDIPDDIGKEQYIIEDGKIKKDDKIKIK